MRGEEGGGRIAWGLVITALPRVAATRYVLPLREGGSLPGLLEADDLGTYVVKFRGAGQGPKALAAEIVVGELGRALGLPVPDLVLVDLDPALAPAEPDQEVQDLLRASAGLNLGMDYLPGSLGFDPTVDDVDPVLAAQVVWFDALVLNVDRSWRNPNLLRWHGQLWLIDHGAALYFHHSWPTAADAGQRAYRGAADHVLLGSAGPLEPAHAALAARVTRDLLEQILALVPDPWLETDGFDDASAVRQAYARVLLARVQHPQAWLRDLEVARAAAV
jgi:hypothetical protein